MKNKEKFTWNGIDLENPRQVKDEPADNAVASIFDSGSMQHLVSLLKNMAKNDKKLVSKELPVDMPDENAMS